MIDLDAHSYQSLRRTARLILGTAGFDTAAMDVKILLCWSADCAASDLIARGKDPVPLGVLERFKTVLRRRLTHEPIAHLIGYREFYGLAFSVSPDVLIPRPETEGLVDQALAILAATTTPHILDIGTGSGAVLIALLANVLDGQGVGVDISARALETAQANGQKHGVSDRAQFILSDLFDRVEGKYDVIVSNPPYISHQALLGLEQDVLAFEPRLALDGGQDGLDFYRKIIMRAPDFLRPSGHLLFEIGYDQQAAVEALMNGGRFDQTQTYFDLDGHARIIVGRMEE